MKKLLIKNATIVNEDKQLESDILVVSQRIEKIAGDIAADHDTKIIDASNKMVMPGMIDDQVHFREPGMTHKGNIQSESRAAIAGGITSFMEMPNVNPSTTTRTALKAKYERAATKSAANYAFYLGATNDNIDEITALRPGEACGVKVFMGASTGNLLVDDETALEAIFKNCPILIATHCEDQKTIQANEKEALAKYGENVPIIEHPNIRSEQACYLSSSHAVDLAKRYNSKLHVLHLTTAKELDLFTSGPITNKRITAEACVHHLFFDETNYPDKTTFIKCNPAIKKPTDRQALLAAVNNDLIDVIATDHAPHTLAEKQQSYFKAPAGLPLVQHALLSLLEHYHRNVFSLETIVKKIAHAPALLYGVKDRGFIREGYFADLVIADLNKTYQVTDDNILYHCQWSPFHGYEFKSSIDTTIVNGKIAYDGKIVSSSIDSMSLQFNQ